VTVAAAELAAAAELPAEEAATATPFKSTRYSPSSLSFLSPALFSLAESCRERERGKKEKSGGYYGKWIAVRWRNLHPRRDNDLLFGTASSLSSSRPFLPSRSHPIFPKATNVISITDDEETTLVVWL